ncbi:glycolipid transfer protein domain-containing protein [Cokeromyces recurvatus]|uniref:glycolipid transfer protein domain-containing protein n=1 Tax=Cokeromyces recurvatus TaxID=90255 RepID=UPI00221FF6CB|nr:glycolipid transfer protein domain-containing protein [Cokeromyces recurvatus]KAI7907090.1 glycolipid transfer protein domain-containing protein [Cokeromyces recurvatus]
MTTFEPTVNLFQKIITRSYANVEVDSEGINTDQFLEATDGLINMFDLFGNSAFMVVQKDMSNNVKKIRTRFLENPIEYNTLEKLMAKEAHLKRRLATEALLWLKRGLEFTAYSLMHNIDHPTEELTVSFSLAYDKTLKAYHSFIVRPVFNLAMNACPWRKDFYEKIGIQDDKSIELMREWLMALSHLIDILNKVFEQNPGYVKH